MEYGIDDIDDTMLANMVVQSGNIKESLGYIYAKAGEISAMQKIWETIEI